jgi:hypothetical protein
MSGGVAIANTRRVTPTNRLPLAKPQAMIIARDPMTGALIGSLVDVSGFRAIFPSSNEDAAMAIDRVRPDVVLLDCDSGDEEVCLTPVARYGGAVILFSPWRAEPEVRAIASRRGLRHFTLPIRWTEFREMLHEVTETNDEA